MYNPEQKLNLEELEDLICNEIDDEELNEFMEQTNIKLKATLDLVKLILEKLDLEVKIIEPDVKLVKKSKK